MTALYKIVQFCAEACFYFFVWFSQLPGNKT